MRARPHVAVLVVTLAAWAAPASAQMLEQPLRPVRGLFGAPSPPGDPARTTQHVTLWGSVLAGYDENLAPESATRVQSTADVQGGYTGFADLGLRYWRGRQRRSFNLEGFGYLMSYSGLQIDPQAGGEVRIGGTVPLGRSSNVELRQQLRADPFLAFGGFGSLRPDVDVGIVPDANPANGLVPQRSWTSNSDASLTWQSWRRTAISASYNYVHHEFTDSRGFNNRTHTARMAVNRPFSRTMAFNASYRYADSLSFQSGILDWPLVTHGVEGGLRYEKRLSPRRRLEISPGGGATHVESSGGVAGNRSVYWAPSGYLSAHVDIGRTGAVSATYRRAVTVLEGITPEPFLADAVLLRAGGLVSDRLELLFSTGYSNGHERTGLFETGRYETFTLAAQARIAVARAWALVVNYHRNDYRLFGFPPPPLGPTPQFDRNAIRIGMTFWYRPHEPRVERPVRRGS